MILVRKIRKKMGKRHTKDNVTQRSVLIYVDKSMTLDNLPELIEEDSDEE